MEVAIGVQDELTTVDYDSVAGDAEDDGAGLGFSFQVNTSAFSAEDFCLFVNSLEQTYTQQQKTVVSGLVDQAAEDEDFDSLYEELNFGDGVSGYEPSSSGETVSSRTSSVESLVHPDAPYNSMVVPEPLSILQTRPSLADIFQYFEKDVTINFEDDPPMTIDEALAAAAAPIVITPPPTPKKPVIKKPSTPVATSKPPSERSAPPPPPPPVGRLSEKLLKIFESETQPPKNNRSESVNPRKAPIIRRNKIDQQPAAESAPAEPPRKKVDNDSIGRRCHWTPPDDDARTPPTPPSTVKIVNATRKVVVEEPRLSIGASSTCSSSNFNTVNRDKCFVRNINDLFLQYRLDQQQVQQAIQQIEKHPMEEQIRNAAAAREEQDDDLVKIRRKSAEETAQQIHFRLQNQTYRLKMRTLIDSQNFVHMTPANRNQLFHLDKIFNRSSLSLIHMVLSLIRENVLMGDRVSVDLETTNYNKFVETMSNGSYGIDSMATSTVRENCVAVEILAVDDEKDAKEAKGEQSAVKIVILFVIETSDESAKRKKTTQDGCGAEREGKRLDGGDYQITVRMRFEPPENELQKSHETGTNLSEHQLRVQASLQRLNIPDWYKQYSSGKDGPAGGHPQVGINSTAPAGTVGATGILRKRNSDVGRWTGLSSKTTSLSSLGSHRSDRSPVMLSPSAHSHHGGQTGFSRWSTSHLNSNQTSPSVSTRGSFTRGGLNASVISGYSTASTTVGATAGACVGGTTNPGAIRNSFRQPYLGWRSQEKLSQPRTPAERLASSLLSQQKAKEQKEAAQQHQNQQQKVEPVVTPEIQSSIKEVTSAIVHYVNDQTNRHSRSRSTSPSQRCWLESSFVGTRPLDSPQTPMIDGNSNSAAATIVLSGQQQQQGQLAGDHYRYNAGRMNGVASTPSATVPTFSLPPDQQSPGSATLEDVLASLLGLPAESHRSSGMNL